MKTLINKLNPAIRITAPEITRAHPPVSNEGYVYWIPAINEMYNPIDWTLVEEEPEKDGVRKLREDLTSYCIAQIKNPITAVTKSGFKVELARRDAYADIDEHFGILAENLPEEIEEEQKPEWSEEDEDMLNRCISSIDEAKENRYVYNETDGDTSYDEEIKWLKSLRPQPKKVMIMSKELEKAAEAYSKPFYEISECGENYTCTPQDAFKAGAEWQKKQSHWKPSEEQMRVLQLCAKTLQVQTHERHIIDSLIDDLKKL